MLHDVIGVGVGESGARKKKQLSVMSERQKTSNYLTRYSCRVFFVVRTSVGDIDILVHLYSS